MIFCHLDPGELDKVGEMEFGGPVVGEKERFRVKFLVNDRAGSIAIEDFPAGKETRWAFWHDEVHFVLDGEAEISYTLPPNHRKVVTRNTKKGDAYVIVNGTRATFRITSKTPYLHACVIMPRYNFDKWLLREEYGEPVESREKGA